MALELELKISRTELTIMDDATITLSLRNMGDEPLLLVDAGSPMIPPFFRVTHRESGQTETFYTKFVPGKVTTFPDAIGPRATLTWERPLRPSVTLVEPGHYEIVAEVPWNQGQGTARSNPVVINQLGSVVQQLALAGIESPFNMICDAYWTEQSDGKYVLHRTTINTADQPLLMGDQVVDTLAANINPVVSDSPNLAGFQEQWVAWLDQRNLNAMLVEPGEEPAAVCNIELPNVRAIIIPNPLMTQERTLEIPLWLCSAEARRAKLQLGLAGAKRDIVAGAELLLPDAEEPVWSHTAFLASLKRRLYMTDRTANKWRLRWTEWDKAHEFRALDVLHEAEGKFAGGTLTVMPDDTVCGFSAFQPAGQPGQLHLLPWTHDAGGAFAVGEAIVANIEQIPNIDRLVMRVDKWRRPLTLLKTLEGRWYYRSPEGEFDSVGGDAGQAKGPVGLLLSSVMTPVIVFGRRHYGLNFADPLGGFPGKVRL